MKKLERLIKNFFLFLVKISILEKDIDLSEIDRTSIQNILIILRHQMGDTLCATPMIRSLRTYYPESKITLVTKISTRWTEIFKDDTSIADVVKLYEGGFENFINLLIDLKDKHFDLAVVPSTVVFSATNHLMAHYSRARIKVGVASINNLDNKASSILNVKSHFMWDTKKTHQIERNLDIIRQLSVQPLETKIKVELTDEQKEYADKFVKENFDAPDKNLIAFHPGAAKESNVWFPENFADLANILNEKYNIGLIVSEGPDDAKYVNKLELLLKEKYPQIKFVRHKGELMNNAAVINKCNLFITNDTGVMHLISGLDVPMIALFGPTDAKIWGPIGEKEVSIQSSSEDINKIMLNTMVETASKMLNSNEITE